MWWFLLWAVLVVGAGLVLFRLGLGVFRSGVSLARELGEASERLSAIAAQVERVGENHRAVELAVFEDPRRLKAERRRRERERRRRRLRAARRRAAAR